MLINAYIFKFCHSMARVQWIVSCFIPFLSLFLGLFSVLFLLLLLLFWGGGGGNTSHCFSLLIILRNIVIIVININCDYLDL